MFWGLFLFLLAVYIPTSSLTLPNSIDPQTNALTAYLIAESGSPVAEGYEAAMDGEGRERSLWLVDSPSGVVSRYPLGTALMAVPAYWLADPGLFPVTIHPYGPGSEAIIMMPEMWPAAVTASLTTAAAIALFAVLMHGMGFRIGQATTAAIVIGFGTALWSVAANALWQHGPAALFIVVGLLLISRGRLELAGLAFAFGVFVRPQIAVAIAVLGLVIAIGERSIKPILRLGGTSALGAAAYVLSNLVIFGATLPIVAGGYALRGVTVRPETRLNALVDTFVDIDRGIFVHSPILIVAVVAIASRSGRNHEHWVLGAAFGGLLYVIFQARPGDFSGGWGFWSYRYPLEGIVFAAPLLAAATLRWTEKDRLRRVAAGVAAVASVMLHAFGTILIDL